MDIIPKWEIIISMKLKKLSDTLKGDKFPFELILDDPSGNSFIENP